FLQADQHMSRQPGQRRELRQRNRSQPIVFENWLPLPGNSNLEAFNCRNPGLPKIEPLGRREKIRGLLRWDTENVSDAEQRDLIIVGRECAALFHQRVNAWRG